MCDIPKQPAIHEWQHLEPSDVEADTSPGCQMSLSSTLTKYMSHLIVFSTHSFHEQLLPKSTEQGHYQQICDMEGKTSQGLHPRERTTDNYKILRVGGRHHQLVIQYHKIRPKC